jgi:hypothetical protein
MTKHQRLLHRSTPTKPSSLRDSSYNGIIDGLVPLLGHFAIRAHVRWVPMLYLDRLNLEERVGATPELGNKKF